MGRRKLNEAPSVGDKKKLIKAFNKKKSFIFKKTYELSTLCDIPACVIVYGPNGDEPPSVWPEEPQGFNSVLARYMNTSSKERNKRALSIIPSMPKKLDAGNNAKQIEKLPANTGVMWDDRINSLSGEELMGLVNQLNSKLDIVNSRIDVMKKAMQNSVKLESEQLYHAAAEEQKMSLMLYNMQTLQGLQQYQCQNPDYFRYHEEQRQQTEMIDTMNQGGFYYNNNNNNNNNNVNVGDYNGFTMNGVPICDPTPLAYYDPRAQLQSQPHQPFMSLLNEA